MPEKGIAIALALSPFFLLVRASVRVSCFRVKDVCFLLILIIAYKNFFVNSLTYRLLFCMEGERAFALAFYCADIN